MKDFTQSALKALGVYLKRGKQALEELKEGSFDEARLTLRWRSAAFHNFRVLDHLATNGGQDITLNLSVREVWKDIQRVDELLEAQLASAREDTGNALKRIRKSRGMIKHYRSGKKDRPNFAKTV
jgi:hypothetical protein